MIEQARAGRRAGIASWAAGLALIVFLGTLGAPAGPVAGVAEAAPCPRVGQPATGLTPQQLRRAMICRINQVRRSRGRDPVRPQRQLQRVAQRHTRVMVRTRCLAHRCGGEAPLQRRIRRSGYLDGAKRWRFAQNTGCAATVRAMVRKWLGSRFHRRNMLRPVFRDLGVGALPRGTHSRCQGAATFTALFAWRSP